MTEMTADEIQFRMLEAEQLQRAGRLEEAAEIYRAICGADPKHAEAHRQLGVVTFQQDRSDEAIALLETAIRLDPGATAAQGDLAEVYVSLGRLDDAAGLLGEALRRDPEAADPHLKLALIAVRQGDKARALEHCGEALARDDGLVGAHQLAGALAYERGELALAQDHLTRARATIPPGADPYHRLIFTLFALGRTGEIADLNPVTGPGETYGELVLRAVAAWQTDDAPATADLLRRAAAVEPALAESPNRHLFHAFKQVLEGSLAVRQAKPHLYQDSDAERLTVLGDSHCLSAGNLRVAIAGQRVHLVPQLVIGCQARHLVQPEPSPQRSAFLAALDRLPEGARILVSLGEYDCRYGQGLFPLLRQHPEFNPDATVDALVDAYLGKLAGLAAERALKLMVMSPPTSNLQMNRLPAAEREPFRRIGRRFNERLRSGCAAGGVTVVDAATVSLDGEGRVRAADYLDSNHLRPETVLRAFAALDAEP